jgi:hypothetical protein
MRKENAEVLFETVGEQLPAAMKPHTPTIPWNLARPSDLCIRESLVELLQGGKEPTPHLHQRPTAITQAAICLVLCPPRPLLDRFPGDESPQRQRPIEPEADKEDLLVRNSRERPKASPNRGHLLLEPLLDLFLRGGDACLTHRPIFDVDEPGFHTANAGHLLGERTTEIDHVVGKARE